MMRRTRLMKWMLIAMAACLLVTLSGCNTVEGVGKDFSAAGQGLADVASDMNPEN